MVLIGKCGDKTNIQILSYKEVINEHQTNCRYRCLIHFCGLHRSKCASCNGQLSFLENRGIPGNRIDGYLRVWIVHRMDHDPVAPEAKKHLK